MEPEFGFRLGKRTPLVRKWNRLRLTLPVGIAVAALSVPFSFVYATEPEVGIQAAVFTPRGQTPHFFTGNPSLSGFQRLILPDSSPAVSLEGVSVVAVSGAEVPAVDQPERAISPPPLARSLAN